MRAPASPRSPWIAVPSAPSPSLHGLAGTRRLLGIRARVGTGARTLFLSVIAVVLVSSAGPNGGRVVALGDSITYGYPNPTSGWAIALGFDNAGVPGNRTDQMLRRVADVLAPGPRLVLVMGGTNDLVQRVPLPTIVANLEAIVARIQGARSDAVLLTIAPPSERSWVARVDSLNEAIRQIAARDRVRLIDIHAALAGADGTFAAGYSVDGVHPTPAGYEAMAAAIRSAVAGAATR